MATYNARVRRAFELTGVNLKSAAGTLIVPVPAVGSKLFLPRQAFARIATKTGSGAEPSVKIGNGGTYDIHAAAALPSRVVGQFVELALDGTSFMQAFDVSATGISVTVTVASTFTVHTADFYLEGYLI
jgi:hypothetical protein